VTALAWLLEILIFLVFLSIFAGLTRLIYDGEMGVGAVWG
jgi:hypothetical protein